MLLCFGCGSLGGTERCLSSTSPVDSVEPMPACMGGEGGGGRGLSVRGGVGLSVSGGDEREGWREGVECEGRGGTECKGRGREGGREGEKRGRGREG